MENETEPSTGLLGENEDEAEDAEYYCEECAEGRSNIDLETPVWDKVNKDQCKIEFACKKLGLSFTDFIALMERETFIEEIENEKVK